MRGNRNRNRRDSLNINILFGLIFSLFFPSNLSYEDHRFSLVEVIRGEELIITGTLRGDSGPAIKRIYPAHPQLEEQRKKELDTPDTPKEFGILFDGTQLLISGDLIEPSHQESFNGGQDVSCLVSWIDDKAHSDQIGWAGDGFPIYGPVGFYGRMYSCSSSSPVNDTCLDSFGGVAGWDSKIDPFQYRYYLTDDAIKCLKYQQNDKITAKGKAKNMEQEGPMACLKTPHYSLRGCCPQGLSCTSIGSSLPPCHQTSQGSLRMEFNQIERVCKPKASERRLSEDTLIEAESDIPTSLPTSFPTSEPSLMPSQVLGSQTEPPSSSPSAQPTSSLATALPSVTPSSDPTPFPTLLPSSLTERPSSNPSSLPTLLSESPSLDPTTLPTTSPSLLPTPIPDTYSPSCFPTLDPTPLATFVTSSPSFQPSSTLSPTYSPSTSFPSSLPSQLPTPPTTPFSPSYLPSTLPSNLPSSLPTALSTSDPTSVPSGLPTSLPSCVPTSFPSSFPSSSPSSLPTTDPSSLPTVYPSIQMIYTLECVSGGCHTEIQTVFMYIFPIILAGAAVLILFLRYSTKCKPPNSIQNHPFQKRGGYLDMDDEEEQGADHLANLKLDFLALGKNEAKKSNVPEDPFNFGNRSTGESKSYTPLFSPEKKRNSVTMAGSTLMDPSPPSSTPNNPPRMSTRKSSSAEFEFADFADFVTVGFDT